MACNRALTKTGFSYLMSFKERLQSFQSSHYGHMYCKPDGNVGRRSKNPEDWILAEPDSFQETSECWIH